MGGTDIGTAAQGLLTDDGKENALVAVYIIHLITGLQLHTGGQGLKAMTL